jgi:hypothetical protein
MYPALRTRPPGYIYGIRSNNDFLYEISVKIVDGRGAPPQPLACMRPVELA